MFIATSPQRSSKCTKHLNNLKKVYGGEGDDDGDGCASTKGHSSKK